MNAQGKSDDTVDIKAFLGKFLSRWYWFVLSVGVAFVAGKIYLDYQQPVYSVSGTVLVNPKASYEKNLGGIGLFNSSENLQNETNLIKSYDLVLKTLLELPEFGISYYHKGDLRTKEMYKNAPYRVEVDSSSLLPVGVSFGITMMPGENKYRIHASSSSAAFYDLRLNSEEKRGKVQLNKVASFGEPVEFNGCRFTVYVNNPHFDQKDSKLYFVINNRFNQAQQYKNRLHVGPLGEESSILRLALTGPLRNKDIDFINKHMEVYIQNELNAKNQVAINTISFIDSQLKDISVNLDSTQKAMADFREEAGVINLEHATTSLVTKLQSLEEQKADLNLKLQYYRYIQEYIEKNKEIENMVVPSAIGISDPVFMNLISTLVQQRGERNELVSSVGKNNPYVEDLDKKIRVTTENLRESITNVINGEELRLQELNKRIVQADSQLKGLTGSEKRFLDIERRFNLNNHLYNFLLEKRAEAGITKASNRPSHTIVDTAKILSSSQVGPNGKLIINASLMAGFMLPLVLIILFDFFNDKIRSKDDVKKATDIPVLGLVGHSKEGGDLVVSRDPKSAVAEALRSVRINLTFLSPSTNNKIITVTSSISGEGKTFLASNLASIFALSGKKTLLIGADMRKPSLSHQFGLTGIEGLSSYLSYQQQDIRKCIKKADLDSLYILPSGPVPPNPAELLAGQKMKEMLQELQEDFDYILIDTPPVGMVADAYSLMTLTDITLYVVRHNYTRNKMLEKVNELASMGKIKNISLVINDFRQKSGAYGYSYGYGYYNGYGNGYGDESLGYSQKILSKFKRKIKV